MYRIEATDLYNTDYEWTGEEFTEETGKDYDSKAEADGAMMMAVMSAEESSICSLRLVKDDKVVKRVYFALD